MRLPRVRSPPPFYIRALLVLTCTGVSFAHGSNDGQKGMGLIMLILVGTVPTAYALNHTVGVSQVQTFAAVSQQVIGAVGNYVDSNTTVADSGPELEDFVTHSQVHPAHHASRCRRWSAISATKRRSTALSAQVPSTMQANVRNQMYLTSETLRLMPKYGPEGKRR